MGRASAAPAGAIAEAGNMTLREYFDTPESVVPQELIYGAMRAAESPAPLHQHAVAGLFLALHEHVSRERLG